VCTRQKLLRHRRAQFGSTVFSTLLSRKFITLDSAQRAIEQERERERERYYYYSVITSACTYVRRDIDDMEENTNAAPVMLYAFIAIYLSAMYYTSFGILAFSLSTLNPRSDAGIHPLLFGFLDRAASPENACREAAFYGYRRYPR